ncbi:MAG: phage tail sheath C-terminal domain-containing protein, partial [Pseudoflavonifractor sp.]
SLTYKKYDGAASVSGAKDNAAAVAAINAGEFFFSISEAGEVVVEYDINSLTTFTTKKTKDYRKNRVMRVYDTFGEWCVLNFPPNKFDNDPDGWGSMEGIGRAGLTQFGEAHAIHNINLETDFTVDRQTSHGDETYFNVALQATDGSEKAYFTIRTK